MSNQSLPDNLAELLVLAYEGKIDPEKFQELDRLLAKNPTARQYYFEFLTIYAGLMQSTTTVDVAGIVHGYTDDKKETIHSAPSDAEGNAHSVREIEEYAERQLQLFLTEQEQTRQVGHQLPRHRSLRFHNDFKRLVSRLHFWLFWAYRGVVIGFIAVVAMLVIMVSISAYHANQVVATLGDQSNATWTDTPADPNLRRGRMVLEEGLAKIRFKKGAEVILQGPSTFELRSAQSMFLENGKLTARITTPQARGFSIDTPNLQLVDFGTEFGALVDKQGDSEVHVFGGQVRLKSTHGDKQKGYFRELTEGRSARVDETGAIREGNSIERLFCRLLPEVPSFGIPGKRLDLADILGGGNGFGSGQMNCAIDPLTGRYSAFDPQKYTKEGTGRYVSVAENEFVDGVFIPNGGQGAAVAISSQGHIFQGCPQTNGLSDGEIQNTHRTIDVRLEKMNFRPRLGDRIFDTADYPHIYMQANVGMTFDLDAIRHRLTYNPIRRFVAECGVCTEIPKNDEEIDFWVLVDGQVRFSRQDATKADGALQVSVSLHEQDRFLTLAVTEGTDGSWLDLGLFAEPALELGPSMQELK